MNELKLQDRIGLPRGSLLRIDDGAGMLVHVREGEVWLTEEDSAADHLLGPGQQYRLTRGGAALAHAFRRSVVTLSVPDGLRPARRIALARSGAAPVLLHPRSPEPARALRGLAARLLAPLVRFDGNAF